MIQKLRRKIILVNMGMVTVLLLAIFSMLCLFNWQQSSREVREAMRFAYHEKNEGQMDTPPIPDADSPLQGEALPDNGMSDQQPMWEKMKENNLLLPLFWVRLDENDQVKLLESKYMEITGDAAAEAVAAALDKGGEEGILWGLGFRYMLNTEKNGTRVLVFADHYDQLTRFGKLTGSLLIGFFLALLGLWGIGIWLARLAVRPVERVWESQRQFVADASHELKTPLTVILANGGILTQQPEKTVGSQIHWVENTMEEARRMQKLVEDMLFLARSDDGGFSMEPRALCLSDLVWNVVLPFEAVAYEQGVELEYDIAEELSVSGDENQLRRLVSILLDNACKYAGDHGKVQLKLERQRDKLCLTVRNTGPEIPLEKLERVFERFYRADESRTRTRGGYGLGLPIAQSIVNGHGGTIWAESSQTQGTTFTVLLDACSDK